MDFNKKGPRAEATAEAGVKQNQPQHTSSARHSQDTDVLAGIPSALHASASRIINRVRRCAPATPAAWRLFAQRVAEQIIRDPYAGPDDARAARAILDVLRANPAALDRTMSDGQLELFREGVRDV